MCTKMPSVRTNDRTWFTDAGSMVVHICKWNLYNFCQCVRFSAVVDLGEGTGTWVFP